MPPRRHLINAVMLMGLLAVARDSVADVWIVDEAGGGDFSTIQEAILASASGDVIEVSAGIYNEALTFCGHDVLVLGVDGAEATILEPPAGAPGVAFVDGEGPLAGLCGFTVRGADTHDMELQEGEEPMGAGIHIRGSCPTLTDLIVEDNYGYYGGGIKIKYDAFPLLQRVVIRNNTAVGCAGGLYMCQSSPTLIDVEVRDNVAEQMNGGGIVIGKNSYPHLHRVLVEGNRTSIDGGGVYLLGNPAEEKYVDALLSNTTIHGNIAGAGGQGAGANIYLYEGVQLTMVNSIVSGAINGEGIYVYGWDSGAPSLHISYTDFWGNHGGDVLAFDAQAHAVVELLEVVESEGNLTEDPLYLDADQDDFQLDPASPCVDAGDEEGTDPDGSRTDMGAYGGPLEVAHDSSECGVGEPVEDCLADGDDDDSAAVVYKKCVCDVRGAPSAPLAPLSLALWWSLRRFRQRGRTGPRPRDYPPIC